MDGSNSAPGWHGECPILYNQASYISTCQPEFSSINSMSLIHFYLDYNFRSRLERILGVGPRTEATKPFSGIIRGIFAAKGLDLTQPEPEKSQCISETLSAAVCVETCFFSAFQLLRRNVIFQKVSHWVRNEPSEAGIWSLRVWRGLLHPEQKKTVVILPHRKVLWPFGTGWFALLKLKHVLLIPWPITTSVISRLPATNINIDLIQFFNHVNIFISRGLPKPFNSG